MAALAVMRERPVPVIWGPVEKTARGAAVVTVACTAVLLLAALADLDPLGYAALAVVAVAAPVYLVTAVIGTVRYEKRRRAVTTSS